MTIFFEEQETDNEQGTQPDRQPRSEVETSKPVSAEQFRNMLDDCIYGTDPDSNPEKESGQQEQVLQIYMKNIEKFRSRHVTSMALRTVAAIISKGEHRKPSSRYKNHLSVH